MTLFSSLLLLGSMALAGEPWWTELGDPGLVEAIDTGLSENGDLAASWERVAASEAMARQARAPMLPTASATFQHSVANRSAVGRGFGISLPGQEDAPKAYNAGSYGLNASWNIDVWGRSYNSVKASSLDARAASGDRDAAAAALAARIANTWYDLVAVEQRLAIVRRQLETQETTLEVTEMRFEGGEATGLDVLQQRQQLAGLRTLLPPLVSMQQVLQQQLAVLLGSEPGAELPARPDVLPDTPERGTVSAEDLVSQRADLKAAEQRVRSARARKCSAMAGVLPTLGANAQLQTQYNDLAFNQDTSAYEIQSFDTWNVGVKATLPLFNGGASYEGIRAARSQQLAAEHSFEQARLMAMAEVQGALIREEQQRAYIAAVDDQVEAAHLAHEQARLRYKNGGAAYLQVLTAANNELSAEMNSVGARRDLLSIHIDLNNALGGGWTTDLGERASR